MQGGALLLGDGGRSAVTASAASSLSSERKVVTHQADSCRMETAWERSYWHGMCKGNATLGLLDLLPTQLVVITGVADEFNPHHPPLQERPISASQTLD